MKEKIRILIIDDNPDDRALTIRELNREFPDMEVEEVVNADDFRQALDRGNFDLVITDFNIKWTDGLNVLEKVKKAYPDCPVIMFTGTGSEEIVVQAMRGGLDDYVVKTISHFVRLPASVRFALRAREERRARHRAEELYGRLFEQVPIGLYSTTPNGEVVAVNQAMVELLRYPDRESLRKINAEDIYMDREDREEWLKLLNEQGTVTDHEYIVKTYDGEGIWVTENSRLVRDTGGQIAYIEGSVVDITERKIAQEELKEAKKKVEQLHVTANNMAKCESEEEIFGITVEVVKDILKFDSCSVLIYDGEALVIKKSSDADLVKGTRNPLDRGICGKTFMEKKTFMVDDIREWPEAKPAKKEYRSVVSAPIGDIGVLQVISNEVGHFDHYDRDLLDILASHILGALQRVRYEKKIRERENLYRSIIENTGTAMAILEEDMSASMVNREMENLTGYTRKELVGAKRWPEFVVEEYLEEMKYYHETRRKDPDSVPNTYTFKFINRYGDTKDMLINVSMIPGTKQSILSLLDITHSIKTLKAFEESQEMFRIAFENTADGMAILDLDGNITEVNGAFCTLINRREKELVKLHFTDLFAEEDKERCKDEFEDMLAGKRKKCEEKVTLSVNEKTYRVTLNMSAIWDSDGKTRQLLAFVRELPGEGGR